jgi:hypothetical protein
MQNNSSTAKLPDIEMNNMEEIRKEKQQIKNKKQESSIIHVDGCTMNHNHNE